MKVLGVIPARYGSTRLPGKPLLDICGKPMLVRVYERVASVEKLDEVVVATDDERIFNLCQTEKISVIMTSDSHKTAANRLDDIVAIWDNDEDKEGAVYCGITVVKPNNRDKGVFCVR